MINWESIHLFSQLAITSKYILQVTLDKSGRVLSSNSEIGPIHSVFDLKDKSIFFSDCFRPADWAKYEAQKLKAQEKSHQSFVVELNKINYSEADTLLTKWEFFFIAEDFGTCIGIGHPIPSSRPYEVGLGDFIEHPFGDCEVLGSLLEDQLLGFWEFDFSTKTESMSQGLAHVLGYTEQQLSQDKNVSWQKHIYSDDFPGLMQDLDTHFRITDNVLFKKEFRICSKMNQVIWVLGYGKTVEWSKTGHPLKIMVVLVDISERKKQAIYMKEHRHFLKELAFEQSHSLRARVANILGLLEIIDSDPKNDESKKLLNIIREETKRLDSSLKKSIQKSVLKNQLIDDKKAT